MCRCRAIDTCVDPLQCVAGESDGGKEIACKIEDRAQSTCLTECQSFVCSPCLD